MQNQHQIHTDIFPACTNITHFEKYCFSFSIKQGEEIRNTQVASPTLNIIFKTISLRIGYHDASNRQQINVAQECTLITHTWSTEAPNLILELPEQQA